MDRPQSNPSDSVVVEMEDENYLHRAVPPEPNSTLLGQNKQPLSINVELPPGALRKPDYRRLDAAEKRPLQAHLSGNTYTQDVDPHPSSNSPIATENVTSKDFVSAESLEAVESGRGGHNRHQTEGRPTNEKAQPKGSLTDSTCTESEIEKKVHGPKKYDGETTSIDSRESAGIADAWARFDKSWQRQVAITNDEVENGYRFSREVDIAYLGFKPRKHDKRQFLRAYPIVGPVPEARLGFNCSLPMTFAQWSFVVGFFIFFAGFGVGAYFYFASDTSLAQGV